MAIFDQVKKGGEMAGQGGFVAPELETFTPPEQLDAVQRVVAAGMKLIYQGDMAEEVQAELARDVPVAQMLAEAAVGWLLILDRQAPQGIPEPIMPMALQALVGEAAEIASKAGKQISQDDFDDATMLGHQLMARKLGYTDEQIMQGVQGQAGQAAEGAMQ